MERIPCAATAVTGAAIGNTVEWFDFAIYGFLATYIAEQFCPSADGTAALLNTFAIFAAAFFMRPLGGYFFGPLGDRIGRKRVLANRDGPDVALDPGSSGWCPATPPSGCLRRCCWCCCAVCKAFPLAASTAAGPASWPNAPTRLRGLIVAFLVWSADLVPPARWR